MKPLSEKELREKIENLKHKVVMGDGTELMINEQLSPNKVDALVELFEQAVEEVIGKAVIDSRIDELQRVKRNPVKGSHGYSKNYVNSRLKQLNTVRVANELKKEL